MHFTYVLKSSTEGNFYIGQTENIEKRIEKHNKGLVLSTKRRRPFILVFEEPFESRKEAINREMYLKSLKGGNEFKKILAKHCEVI